MKQNDDALAIFHAALASVDPQTMVEKALMIDELEGGPFLTVRTLTEKVRYNLLAYDRIFATGMGKAGAGMAAGLEKVLGERLSGGLVVVKEGQSSNLKTIKFMESSHPVPDERSQSAARAILALGSSLGTELTERDLIIVLISGGGSALLCAPAGALSLADKAETTKLLLASGATIHEVNCVRKHLSAIKGGRLAQALSPATVLALVLSDVVGDDLDVIASGPTVPDPTSFADACAIVRRHGLEETLPSAVMNYLEAGLAGIVADTPKTGDRAFERVRTILVGTNRLALAAADAEAKRRGYNTLILSSRITGEAREIAQVYHGIAQDIARADIPLQRPACVIAGGETTVTIRGKGKGGRNQEMALAFLASLGKMSGSSEGICLLSAGSDGVDGPTDAAGAMVDMGLYRKAEELGLDPDGYLVENDSYGFFSRLDGHVMTGPTGTNICDLQILIVA